MINLFEIFDSEVLYVNFFDDDDDVFEVSFVYFVFLVLVLKEVNCGSYFCEEDGEDFILVKVERIFDKVWYLLMEVFIIYF